MSRVRDRGSAAVWVLACCALLVVVATVGVVRALAVLARHRAEASADLAALAAAGRIGVSDDACGAAARDAARNGARLTSCRLTLAADGRSGTVTVRVSYVARLPLAGTRAVTASARAARLPADGSALPAAVASGSSPPTARSGRSPPACSAARAAIASARCRR